MMNKLDDLIEKMKEVKEHLATLATNNEKFERFMQDKIQHDELTKQQIDSLLNNDNAFKKDLVHHSLLIERHENMFIKLLITMFEDLFTLIAGQNQDKIGNTLDADLKCRLDRYLIQMKKTREDKSYLN
ncbi:unnamed protein product [Rotaria magnacalcarata]|uniref:Uncharacterized protein n=1 Tax=Rotaria magnacalcarata TaxID=392030 RepID=A0A816QE65_9BILA|nr:unnamed protein product [Rotaria magnacalcarata]CAF1476973.1 unnamed protein product [Rotaria magnacalcarata]CAF2059613.1 unnamed protein product [Rotaria magnacalcarata]CAF3905218.1 unnamed protein product [Rotaria magnacalcarata]CAF3920222.1 unnamed protein product [Rotaria magnacalcarata]